MRNVAKARQNKPLSTAPVVIPPSLHKRPPEPIGPATIREIEESNRKREIKEGLEPGTIPSHANGYHPVVAFEDTIQIRGKPTIRKRSQGSTNAGDVT